MDPSLEHIPSTELLKINTSHAAQLTPQHSNDPSIDVNHIVFDDEEALPSGVPQSAPIAPKVLPTAPRADLQGRARKSRVGFHDPSRNTFFSASSVIPTDAQREAPAAR